MTRLLHPLCTVAILGTACGTSSSTASDAGTSPGSDSGMLPDSDTGSCTTSSRGTLAITVDGLPAGVDAAVKVTGPAGQQAVTATASLDVASGDYTLQAITVTAPDPIVRRAFAGAPATQSAHVCDGETVTLTVTYALIPTSNKLWWGNVNGANGTLGYYSASLASTGSPTAAIAADTKGHLPGAFDREGNLWVVDAITDSTGLERYSAASLASGGAKTADVVLTSDEFAGGVPGPVSLTFDAAGNLWVGVAFSKKIVRLPAAMLAASAAITPTIAISNIPSGPNALAFDASGDLWVGAGGNVLKYAAARLTASTSDPADLSIESKSPPPVISTLPNALGLAFDASANLWVDYDGTLAKITPAEQSATGTSSITPGVQITADVTALPEGLAFDEGGGLWMAYSVGKFAKFGAAQLGASGTLAPEVVISGNDVASATMPALYPAPAALPLFSALP